MSRKLQKQLIAEIKQAVATGDDATVRKCYQDLVTMTSANHAQIAILKAEINLWKVMAAIW